MRQELLRRVVLLCLGMFVCLLQAAGDDDGWRPLNPTGQPVGGGAGYTLLAVQPATPVSSVKGLIAALQAARPGDLVYISDDAILDLSDKGPLRISERVTLASGRGRAGSKGALLFSKTLATRPLLLIGGRKVRITGLRLRGPDPERRTEKFRKLLKAGDRKGYYAFPTSDGIISEHRELEVDNCELSGWSHAAIFLKKGAGKAFIHHNFIHHNQRYGLGYGICLDQADALIEANLFDWCRHHIAGTGRPGTSYEARYNRVLGNANSHSFDMHGGRDRKDGTDIAGDRILIHHNSFRAAKVAAIVIRGKAREAVEIHDNDFIHKSARAAIRQLNARGRMKVENNRFGLR